MFQNLKNIDTAFQYVRYFSIVAVLGSFSLSTFLGVKSFRAIEEAQDRIYILAGEKAIEAFSASRRENIPVEARDHVRMFHHYFFTLGPDENFIKEQISKSLYMADGSAKKVYDAYLERGYYSELVSANISQTLETDSVKVSLDEYPYVFHYYGTQKITRTTSVVTRKLLTRGKLRHIDRTDRNPHGFLIESWETVSNQDIKIEKR